MKVHHMFSIKDYNERKYFLISTIQQGNFLSIILNGKSNFQRMFSNLN